MFRPQSPEHPDDESFPGLLLLRPEGPIFFANAAQIAHKIEPLVREAQPKIVAVEASGVLDMEYTAVKMFAQLAKRQSQHGVQLWLIGMTPRVLAIVQRSPLGQLLGREGMHFNLEIAVARYLDDEAVREQSWDMARGAEETNGYFDHGAIASYSFIQAAYSTTRPLPKRPKSRGSEQDLGHGSREEAPKSESSMHSECAACSLSFRSNPSR